MRQGAPLVAALHDVEDRIDDLTARMTRRASSGLDGGNQRLQERPFLVTKIAWVALAGRCWKCLHTLSLPRFGGFQDSL